MNSSWIKIFDSFNRPGDGIQEKTYVMEMPGGFIVKNCSSSYNRTNSHTSLSESMCFLPGATLAALQEMLNPKEETE